MINVLKKTSFENETGREKDPDIHVDVCTPFTPTTSEDGEIAFGDACDKATPAKAR